MALTHLPALALVTATSIAVSLGIRTGESSTDGMLDAKRQLELVTELVGAVVQVQSAHRGYLLEASDATLGDYHEGVRQVWAVYGELRHDSAGYPERQRDLAEIITLFQAWGSSVEPSFEARRSLAPGASFELSSPRSVPTRDPLGSELLQSIRKKADRLRSHARASLQANDERRQMATGAAHALALFAPVLILLGTICVSLWFALRTTRALAGLRRAADRFAQGELDVRADVDGDDDMLSVARSFNSMAGQLAQRTQRAALLAEISETLQACTTFDEACKVLARVAPRLLPETTGTLSVFNASRNAVIPVASWGGHAIGEGFDPDDCWSLRKGRVHLFHPPRHGIACRHIEPELDSNAQVCIPMTAQGDPIGVLHLDFGDLGLTEVNRTLELATTAAERFALALANLRLRDSLRDRSIRDPLTGLFNRRYLEETLDREFGRAERSDESLSTLVIDVDHFKRFNDQNGHEAGDAVLAHMGRLLSTYFRTSDIPCRYGGEEFVVVMPDAALVDAVHRAETLREMVAAQAVEYRGTLLGPVTLSIGVACFPIHGVRPDEILRSADAALYAAKKAGRNCVVVASDASAAALSSPERPSHTGRRSAA
jgi:diguanylate cyclase (GGDEF)-like protein